MFLRRHQLKILWIIVSIVSVDMVDVISRRYFHAVMFFPCYASIFMEIITLPAFPHRRIRPPEIRCDSGQAHFLDAFGASLPPEKGQSDLLLGGFTQGSPLKQSRYCGVLFWRMFSTLVRTPSIPISFQCGFAEFLAMLWRKNSPTQSFAYIRTMGRGHFHSLVRFAHFSSDCFWHKTVIIHCLYPLYKNNIRLGRCQ